MLTAVSLLLLFSSIYTPQVFLRDVHIFHRLYIILLKKVKLPYLTKRISPIRMQPSWMSLQYSFSCIITETIPFLALPLYKSHTLLISVTIFFNFGKLYLKKRTQGIRELFNCRPKSSAINLLGGQLCSRPPGGVRHEWRLSPD